jgi:tight adherence protein B
VIIALVSVLAGVALMVASGVTHRRTQERAIDDLLGITTFRLAPDEDGVAVSALADRAVVLAGQVVERVDRDRSLGQALDRAKIPLRPGEFVIVAAGMGLGAAAVLLAVAHSVAVALLGLLGAAVLAVQVVRRRIAKRKAAFEAQLPDALSLIASSLSAGHTFLRAILMMCEESDPPLAEEFGRVVAETRLGDPVVDALERMAGRLQIRDLDIVVQAIRIQQTVGGRLAELLHTLSDFIRARDEVRREVRVLTAEGRMSAYVLAAMVPVLLGVIQLMNPGYVAPLYRGWGLMVLAASGGSVLAGMLMILRMVRIDV